MCDGTLLRPRVRTQTYANHQTLQTLGGGMTLGKGEVLLPRCHTIRYTAAAVAAELATATAAAAAAEAVAVIVVEVVLGVLVVAEPTEA